MTEHRRRSEVGTFVESMGLLWEREGLPRIAGRIFGLVCTTAEPCSLDDMTRLLGVSKASISTDARRLEQIGLLERVTVPGDRRDYYTISPEAPARMLARRLEFTGQFTLAFDRLHGVELPPKVAARLEAFERTNHGIVSALTTVLRDLTDTACDTNRATRPYRNSPT